MATFFTILASLAQLLTYDPLFQVHSYPADSAVQGPTEFYMFTADKQSGDMTGLKVHGNTLQVYCMGDQQWAMLGVDWVTCDIPFAIVLAWGF